METRAEIRRPVTAIGWESVAMFAICLADTISTVMLAGAHKIAEANPLMAKCLEISPSTFCTVKMSTVLILLVMAEYHRRSNPTFVSRVMKLGVAAYLLIYISAVLVVNGL